MAKQKQTETEVVPVDYLDKLTKDLTKKYGEVMFGGQDMVDKPHIIISLSPALDTVLGGGISEGSIIAVSGKPKSGKSTAALAFARNCQQAGRHVYYLDIEHRLQRMNLLGTHDLDISSDKFTHIHSTRGNILTAEKFLSIADEIINTHPGALIILDSLSAICMEKEMIGEMDANTRQGGPKLISLFLKKVANIIPVNGIILWCNQHLIANTSGYGPTFMEDGGNKIQYYINYKLRVKGTKQWQIGSGENLKNVGLITTWQMLCSALGGIPGSEIDGYLRYGYGIDDIMELIQMSLGLGIIVQTGAWYTYKEAKLQGLENAYLYFKDNKTELNILRDEIRKLYQ
jgi:recombination protein RecA